MQHQTVDIFTSQVAPHERGLAALTTSRTRVQEIIVKAAALFDVDQEEIVGRDRTPRVSKARQWVMLEAQHAGHSLNQIGAVIDRNHTTVLYGAKQEFKRRLRFVAAGSDPRHYNVNL